jgi:hypothetical protein
MRAGMVEKNLIGKTEGRTGGEGTNLRRKHIVHLDVIAMGTVSESERDRWTEREVGVRRGNLEARDMMVSSRLLLVAERS